MKEYTSYEIQDISSSFRNVARRLSRTDYSQCDTNLKRFMTTIQNEELISNYIDKNNTVTYDIAAIIKARGWLNPFEVSPIESEEIAFSVQVLKYAVEYYNGDFTRLYNTVHYTSSNSTVEDEMRKFIDHIIDPLIDHIADHLKHCYDEAARKEGVGLMSTLPNVNAENSTVVIGSSVGGNVTTEVSITQEQQTDANDLIIAIKEALAAENIPDKEDIEEMLQQIESDVDAGKKPRRGFLIALKGLCSAGATLIPLVKSLIGLF
ncbi:MAG: hypothetical protein U0L27_05170 [Ruminococcus sp.]|nr:hypothetical protein [Ruminococcus sp.]